VVVKPKKEKRHPDALMVRLSDSDRRLLGRIAYHIGTSRASDAFRYAVRKMASIASPPEPNGDTYDGDDCTPFMVRLGADDRRILASVAGYVGYGSLATGARRAIRVIAGLSPAAPRRDEERFVKK
jgi:hypothetical protein